MPITLLLDLDDTLLDNGGDAFLPAYFAALADNLSDVVTPDAMLGAMKAGVKQMMMGRDSGRTLEEVWSTEFYPRLNVEAGSLRERLMRFYDEPYRALRRITHERPGARDLVEWAVSTGHRLALATDPVFPLVATVERVRWAGLDPACFELISSIETFHFTKAHPAYFAEILGRLGWPDRPVVMAGNDVDRDLGTASRLGLTTFHVNMSDHAGERSGDLHRLRQWIEEIESSLKPPVFQTPEAVMAVLEASPGALQGMTVGITPQEWTHEASADDWALVELVCHLRDTEREVHSQQIATLLESPAPFVARPDAAVWAKQRRYLNENPQQALKEFAAARAACVERLGAAPESAWSKQARHAIFGPSSFLEVVGFMAEHDRLHLRQAWRTLRAAQQAAHRN